MAPAAGRRRAPALGAGELTAEQALTSPPRPRTVDTIIKTSSAARDGREYDLQTNSTLHEVDSLIDQMQSAPRASSSRRTRAAGAQPQAVASSGGAAARRVVARRRRAAAAEAAAAAARGPGGDEAEEVLAGAARLDHQAALRRQPRDGALGERPAAARHRLVVARDHVRGHATRRRRRTSAACAAGRRRRSRAAAARPDRRGAPHRSASRRSSNATTSWRRARWPRSRSATRRSSSRGATARRCCAGASRHPPLRVEPFGGKVGDPGDAPRGSALLVRKSLRPSASTPVARRRRRTRRRCGGGGGAAPTRRGGGASATSSSAAAVDDLGGAAPSAARRERPAEKAPPPRAPAPPAHPARQGIARRLRGARDRAAAAPRDDRARGRRRHADPQLGPQRAGVVVARRAPPSPVGTRGATLRRSQAGRARPATTSASRSRRPSSSTRRRWRGCGVRPGASS